jgi:2-C-methyl-D-erythritol 2,4-cyclodiphosphate synthase
MNTPINFRIGEGWDVHALVPGRPLVIGGVTIPHPVGLLGHSDADVLLHAIITHHHLMGFHLIGETLFNHLARDTL